jgi:hypothetical protein
MAATAHLTAAAPDNEKFTVRSAPARLPRRKPNSEYRSREHRTEREVERLIEAAKGNRWVTAILQWCSWPLGTAYGYRIGGSSVGEQVDLEHALLHVRRVKERQPCHAPIDQQGITRREANTARAGGQITFRLHQRAWSAILKAGLSGDGRARW